MKQRIRAYIGASWRHLLFYAVLIVIVGAVLGWHLGSLVPGFSAPEEVSRFYASSFRRIVNDPLFLPHKVIQYALIRTGHTNAFWMRSVSALWGAAILVVFYDIIHTWYSRRIALMSGFLLITSAWFLHFARLGTPQIMFATSIGLLWVGMKLRLASAPRIRTILASFTILIVCLYVPGFAWMIIPMLIWQRKTVLQEFNKIPRWLGGLTLVGIALSLSPLVYGLVKHPRLALEWLLIPVSFAPRTFLSQAWHIPVWFLWRGPHYPIYWLGHVPMFDSFSIAMLFLGGFVLYHYSLLDRVRAVTAIIAFSLVMTVLNGWVALVIALPLLFVVIAAGVALFLQQWFTVFPVNPLARVVGIGLVSFVIALTGYYNVRHYFVAWPRNADTKQVFQSHLLL